MVDERTRETEESHKTPNIHVTGRQSRETAAASNIKAAAAAAVATAVAPTPLNLAGGGRGI